MTSKLVVNTIEADTGISSVSFASSISLSSTSVFHLGNAGLNIGADTNINRPSAGVIGFNINGSEAARINANGFSGDGSQLTGLPAGLGTALSTVQTSPLNKLYYTDRILSIGSTVTVDHPASATGAYTQYADILVEDNADLIVADGDDLIPDILGLGGNGTTGAGGAGRLLVDNIVNRSATGAPSFPNGAVVTGVVTATSFVGNGANLTGLSSGLSFAQQWRLTSNKSTSSTTSDISANLEVVDSDGYGGLGGTMTQSSGVFTFPSTGIYLIMAKGAYSASGGATSGYNEMDLHTTTDGSSFNRAAIGWCYIASGGYGTAACDFVFNVTNTSTHKVKFRAASASSNAYLTANTNDNQTHFTFIKLG